jgi:hypothetical protein
VKLHVATHGGTVTAYGMHLRCRHSCSLSVPRQQPVILEARPQRLFSFDHWSGACHGRGTACVLSPSRASSARAVFARHTGEVLMTAGGAGSIRVVHHAKDRCGPSSADCDIYWPTQRNIELAAVPAAGGSFGGWAGACAGTSGAVCHVMVHKRGLEVAAAFATTPAGSGDQQQLQVQARDAPVGSSLAGFSCGPKTNCSTAVATGTLVKLQLPPSGVPNFSHWKGACVGYGFTCALVVDGPARMTAPLLKLYAPPVTGNTLNVSVAGDGVVSDRAGHRCASMLGARNCQWAYSSVRARLTAKPRKGFAFDAWIRDFGACSPASRPTCTLPVGSSGTTVTARFVRGP